jgi:hypothetical protein
MGIFYKLKIYTMNFIFNFFANVDDTYKDLDSSPIFENESLVVHISKFLDNDDILVLFSVN